MSGTRHPAGTARLFQATWVNPAGPFPPIESRCRAKGDTFRGVAPARGGAGPRHLGPGSGTYRRDRCLRSDTTLSRCRPARFYTDCHDDHWTDRCRTHRKPDRATGGGKRVQRRHQQFSWAGHLVRELVRAVGLGGRDRRAGSRSERARASVTRAVRQAMARIREHNSPLAEHLDQAIRTGTYCAYLPDSRVPVVWHL